MSFIMLFTYIIKYTFIYKEEFKEEANNEITLQLNEIKALEASVQNKHER